MVIADLDPSVFRYHKTNVHGIWEHARVGDYHTIGCVDQSVGLFVGSKYLFLTFRANSRMRSTVVAKRIVAVTGPNAPA